MTVPVTATGERVEQMGLGKAVVLHLLPGVLVLVFFVLVAPLVVRAGFPALVALLLAALVVLVPFQLGYMLYQGRQETGRLALQPVLAYREPMPAWQIAGLAVVFLIWSLFWFNLLAPLDALIRAQLFGWLPEWFFVDRIGDTWEVYSPAAPVVTLLLSLLVNGLAAPIAEELYFRGYLLPRLAYLRSWAPFVNVVLFSLYHFFSPWQSLTRIVALLPLVYAVWWKRNFYISLVTHVALNVLGVLISAALVLR